MTRNKSFSKCLKWRRWRRGNRALPNGLLSLLILFVCGWDPLAANPIETIRASVRSRTGKTIRWEEDEATRIRAEQDVRVLLVKPLTLAAAVQIALLNNRSLQATFEEVGLSTADWQEAGTIPNPSLDLSLRFPDKAPSGTDVEYSAAIDFLRLMMIPMKKRIAKQQLEATTLRVADEALQLVADVKSAYYSVQEGSNCKYA